MNEIVVSPTKRVVALIAIALLSVILIVALSSSPVQGKEGAAVSPVQSAKLQSAAPDSALNNIGQVVGDLRIATNGKVKITYSRSTPAVSYVGLDGVWALTDGASAMAEAMAFFNTYGGVFGMTDVAAELAFVGSQVDSAGNTHFTFQQAYQGVPVFGAVLRVHLNPENAITSLTGVFIPGLALSTSPAVSVADANIIAITSVGETKDVSNASAVESNLVVFRTGLVQGIYGTNHLAYEVEVGDGMTVREFVYLDAQSGRILDTYTGIHEAKDRETWDAMGGPAPGGVLCRDEGDPQVGDLACDEAHDYAGDTYDYFDLGFGRDSLDDAGLQLLSYVDVCPTGCPWNNASWNGSFMQYGTNPAGRSLTADDTVAHEFGHGITQFTSNLIYAWQPGAMNEALSDVYGETVDKINGAGIDTPDLPRADYPANSTGTYPAASHCVAPFGWDDTNTYTNVRWLQGENDWLIRDMWAPSCMGDPDHVSHPNYSCSTSDNGGVHTNSGVVNHHYALLVDGGTFNGQTVNGIGLTKAGAIYYQAQTMYLGPTSNFADLEAALNQSCTDLVGTDPNDPTTGNPSGNPIAAVDCGEVAAASAAVELAFDPAGQCGFQPILDPSAPALCENAGNPSTIFSEDWEGGLGSWTVGTRNVANPATFDTPDWAVVGGLPDSRPGSATFVLDDPALGDCGADTEAGVLYLESPDIVVPAGVTQTHVAFNHWVATEATWDGGNVKVSVNGGAWTLVDSAAFNFNPYNSALASVGAGSDNPMAGEVAFTGTDGGEVGGSWGQSQLSLAGIATEGDTVRIRYEFGLDGCNGVIGWYVDEVEVYSCSGGPTDVSLTGFDQQPTSAGSFSAIGLVVVLTAVVGLGMVVRRKVSASRL